MLYRKNKNTWINAIEPLSVSRTDNSQITCSVTRLKNMETYYVSLREFSHYVTKAERIGGASLETTPYRPTANGVTFPLDKLDEVIDTLLQLKFDLKEIQSLG